MIVNTAGLHDDEWRSTIPAEACTDIGADQDQGGEGGMIAALFVAVALVVSALGLVHIVARVMS